MFEVLNVNGDKARTGAIVEGVETGEYYGSYTGKPCTVVPGYLGCRVVESADIAADVDEVVEYVFKLGSYFYQNEIESLRPLTPAAVEMLAIAKAGAK